MGKFLAIYNGAADESKKGQLSEAEQLEFLSAWARWAQANQQALVDPGAPLYMKKRVTSGGVTDFTDFRTGYSIVVADTHDEAVRIFADHPHLALTDGNSIDVLECPPLPGQSS